MKFNFIYIRWIFIGFLVAILAACSGGGSTSSNNGGGAPISYNLPNGSNLSLPISSLTINPSESGATQITLSGGSSGLVVNLSSVVTESLADLAAKVVAVSNPIPISVTITPSTLTSGGTSLAQVLISVPYYLPAGTYYVKLYASYNYNNIPTKVQYGVLTIVVGTPPPVSVVESGVAAFGDNGYFMAYSQAASTGNWESYISGPISNNGNPTSAAITSIAVANNRTIAIAGISTNAIGSEKNEVLVSYNRSQWKPVIIPGYGTQITSVITNGTNFYMWGRNGTKFAGICNGQGSQQNWTWTCPWTDYNQLKGISTTDGVNFNIQNTEFATNTGVGIANDGSQGEALTPDGIGNNQIWQDPANTGNNSTPQGYTTVNGGKNVVMDASGNIWIVSPNRVESASTSASVAIYKSSDNGATFQLESNIVVNPGFESHITNTTLTVQAATIVNSSATQQAKQALVFVTSVFNSGTTSIYAIPLDAIDQAHTVDVTAQINNTNTNVHGFSVSNITQLDQEPQVTYSVTNDPTQLVYIVASNFNQYLDPTHIETAIFRVSIDINNNLTVGSPKNIQYSGAIQLSVAGPNFESATTTPIISSVIYDSDSAESGLIAIDTNYPQGWGNGSSAGSIITAVGANGPNRGNQWIQFNPKSQNTNPIFTPIFPVEFNVNSFNASVVATSPTSDPFNDLYFGDTNSNIAYSPESTYVTYFMPSGSEQASSSKWVGIASSGLHTLMLAANGMVIDIANGESQVLPTIVTESTGAAYPDGYINGLTYGNGVFVATTNNNTIFTSTDNGLSWSAESALPVTTGNLIYANGIFVNYPTATVNKTLSGVANESATIYVSIDGVNWSTGAIASFPVNDLVTPNYITSVSNYGLMWDGATWLAYGSGMSAVTAGNAGLYPNYATTFSASMANPWTAWTSIQPNLPGFQANNTAYNPVSYDLKNGTYVAVGADQGALYTTQITSQPWQQIVPQFQSNGQYLYTTGFQQFVFSGLEYVGIATSTAPNSLANVFVTNPANLATFTSAFPQPTGISFVGLRLY